jgi:hypothetical protein
VADEDRRSISLGKLVITPKYLTRNRQEWPVSLFRGFWRPQMVHLVQKLRGDDTDRCVEFLWKVSGSGKFPRTMGDVQWRKASSSSSFCSCGQWQVSFTRQKTHGGRLIPTCKIIHVWWCWLVFERQNLRLVFLWWKRCRYNISWYNIITCFSDYRRDLDW